MLFFPLPCTYAVVELDVEKTLECLDDPVANAAGARIKPAKCIVYLPLILQLPFPDDATFKYMACVVGPSLRPDVPDLCLTPDMCVPIFPNTQHPSGDREPVKSDPPFPFGNCYHWFGSDTWLDLRICNDGRDYRADARTVLPADQHVDLGMIQGEDVWRCVKAQREKYPIQANDAHSAAEPAAPEPDDSDEAPPQKRDASPTPEGSPPTAAPSRDDAASMRSATRSISNSVGSECHFGEQCDCCGAYGDCYSESGSDYSQSQRSTGPFYQASEDANESTEALAQIDVFGRDGDDNDDLLPIVKIWLDIGAHFASEDDIPNPVEFMQQRNELVRIVKESKARAREAREAAELEAATEESHELALALESVALGDAPKSAGEECPRLIAADGSDGKRQSKGFWSKLATVPTSLLKSA